MKKSKILVITLVLLSVLTVVVLVATRGFDPLRSPEIVGEDRVVVIKLTGAIQESAGGFFAGGISPDLVYHQLKKAAGDRTIEGVVLRVESPGGAIAASQEIAAMIRDFEKPLVVSMGDMAASGGYYISVYAQGIVAQRGTLTGSIGVISTFMDMEDLYDMLGIKVETIKSGRHKDMFSRTLTEEERRIMQDISDVAYEQFIEDVALGRDMDRAAVRRLATGEIYLGSQALEHGLVDRLGGVEEAIEYLAELNDLQEPVRYEFPQPSPFTRMFDFGYRALHSLERAFVDTELILLEKITEGFPPDIRYQVR